MTHRRDDPHPPRLSEWILTRLLPSDEFDTAAGDFEEMFREIAAERSAGFARWWYRAQLTRLLPDRIFANTRWTFVMLRSYLEIALRNLRRHTTYSFINLSGLAVGLATFFLIALFVRHQLGYDRFHDESDNIFRIVRTTMNDEVPGMSSYMPYNLGSSMADDFPGVKRAVRLMTESRLVIRRPGSDGREFYEEGMLLTEPSFFDVFSFRLSRGDPGQVLRSPNGVLLTESAAKRYFGDDDPMGGKLTLNNEHEVVVEGIVADPSDQSSIQLTMLAPLDAPWGRRTRLSRFVQGDWAPNSYTTYVLLAENADPDRLASLVPEHLSGLMAEDVADLASMRNGDAATFVLEPLSRTYLFSDANNAIGPVGEVRYLYVFGTVALLILLVAAVNYMNLATARSVRRAREVGLRKVFGAARKQLLMQFFGEALLIGLLALPLAALLVFLAIPEFSRLVQADMSLAWPRDASLIGFVLAFTTIVALFSGTYPAIFLSGFKPIRALRDTFIPGRGHFGLRRTLVVFQLSVSAALIVGSVLIQRQLEFVRSADLGLDEERIVALSLWRTPASAGAVSLRNALSAQPFVEQASISTLVPTRLAAGMVSMGGAENDLDVDEILSVDDDFLETYRMRLVEGRGFGSTMSTSEDVVPVVVNQAAARALESLGTGAVLGGRFTLSGVRAEVIGIVENFHTSSLHETVAPLMMRPLDENRGRSNYVSIRLRDGDASDAVDRVASVWEEFAPDHPMDYFFLDEAYDAMYRAEDRLSETFFWFTGIVVFVACLGLFGLAAFAAEQRTREIGIRKVLGATPLSIAGLLSKDFLKLTCIGLVVGIPVAWVGIGRWLDGFAYHASTPYWVILACCLATAGIALFAVSYQAMRAAALDPAESLRHE